MGVFCRFSYLFLNNFDFGFSHQYTLIQELVPFSKDLIDVVMGAASNILSALSNASFPSMDDLFISVKLTITELLKVSHSKLKNLRKQVRYKQGQGCVQ